MRMIKLAELVLDYSIYPRTQTDNNHVRYLMIAVQGGATLPPIIIDKKSKRVIDGFHRVTGWRRIDKHGEIEVIEKTYKNDSEMFAEAMRLNAQHGRNLAPYDRMHCIIRAEEMGMTYEQIAKELCLTVEAIGEMRAGRCGEMRVGNKMKSFPIKRTIQHMAGKKLTKAQFEANDKLGGMNQLFYVNQLIELIEADLLDLSNERLMERLADLVKALESLKIAA